MNPMLGAGLPFATNSIVRAIGTLYGVGADINEFLDTHIAGMKRNASATIRATGNVLEAAKFGFGLGYMTSTVIIAIGQIILGNPWLAGKAVVTAAIGINPVAMTCGAVGAIYYGWKALDESERNGIVNRITEAYEVGAELIKSIVNFLLNSLGELVSAENLAEYKRLVSEAASEFGKSISDITRTVRDRMVDAASAVTHAVAKSSDLALEGVSAAADSVKKNLNRAASSVADGAESAKQFVRGPGSKD